MEKNSKYLELADRLTQHEIAKLIEKAIKDAQLIECQSKEIERLREGFLYFKSQKLNQLKTDETNSERPTFEVF